MRRGLGSGGLRGDEHVTAEIMEPAYQTADGLGPVSAIEVVRAKVVVVDTVAQHEEGSGEHRGGDGEDGFLGTAAGFDAEELGTQVAFLHSDGCPGSGDQRRLEPVGALADAGRTPLARTLVVARTEPGPGYEMTAGGEARHVDADL